MRQVIIFLPPRWIMGFRWIPGSITIARHRWGSIPVTRSEFSFASSTSCFSFSSSSPHPLLPFVCSVWFIRICWELGMNGQEVVMRDAVLRIYCTMMNFSFAIRFICCPAIGGNNFCNNISSNTTRTATHTPHLITVSFCYQLAQNILSRSSCGYCEGQGCRYKPLVVHNLQDDVSKALERNSVQHQMTNTRSYASPGERKKKKIALLWVCLENKNSIVTPD